MLDFWNWDVTPLRWDFSFGIGDLAVLMIAISTFMIQRRQTRIMEWHKDEQAEQKRRFRYVEKKRIFGEVFRLNYEIAIRSLKVDDTSWLSLRDSWQLIDDYFEEWERGVIEDILKDYGQYMHVMRVLAESEEKGSHLDKFASNARARTDQIRRMVDNLTY